jgi:hypothetical protein
VEEQKYKTVKELDGALQGIEEAVSKIREDMASLATAEQINELVESLKPDLSQPAPETNSDQIVGQVTAPVGNYKDEHGFDPTLHIEVAMKPIEGVQAKILAFPAAKEGETLRYAPVFDDEKRAHYYLPRRFGEAQLKNQAGMRWVLCWPKVLTVAMRGERMRREMRTFTADPAYSPILVRDDGTPIQRAPVSA